MLYMLYFIDNDILIYKCYLKNIQYITLDNNNKSNPKFNAAITCSVSN